MSYLPFTKNGHNMFEVSSLIQKAIRRKDMEYACYAAREMMFKYRSYLWKRMIVVTAEDCFDLVTRPIFILRQRDEECGNINETKHISQAVNLLVNTRKNRDADFFACNLLNSKNKWDVCPDGDGYLVTRHGHDLKTMAALLKKTILNAEDELCGYIGNEIRNWYLGLFWSIVRDAARELGYPSIMREIDVLWTIDMSKPVKDTTFIYAAKALTILMRVAKEGNADFYQMFDVHQYVDVSVFDNFRNIPEYTFDCHTIKGKQRGLTDADFIVSEQAALNPLQRDGTMNVIGGETRSVLRMATAMTSPLPKSRRMSLIVLTGECSPCRCLTYEPTVSPHYDRRIADPNLHYRCRCFLAEHHHL